MPSIQSLGFNPVGDGVTDDSAIIAAALASISKGAIWFPAKTYFLGTTTIRVPAGKRVIGDGPQGTTFKFAGAQAFAFEVGNHVIGSPRAWGCALRDLGILLTDPSGRGVNLCETVEADLSHVYVEAPPATPGSQGVKIDGGNSGSFYTKLDSVTCNHVETAFYYTSTGSSICTSIDAIACRATGDNMASNEGLVVDRNCGAGSTWTGGNVEAMARGFDVNGVAMSFHGPRCEGNATDVWLGANAEGITFHGPMGVASVVDLAHNPTNKFFGRSSGLSHPVIGSP